MLTFEGQKTMGSAAILQKLTSLPFTQCQHRISSLDAQPSMSQGINIVVTGQIIVRPLRHAQPGSCRFLWVHACCCTNLIVGHLIDDTVTKMLPLRCPRQKASRSR